MNVIYLDNKVLDVGDAGVPPCTPRTAVPTVLSQTCVCEGSSWQFSATLTGHEVSETCQNRDRHDDGENITEECIERQLGTQG